ncbi:MAG: RNA 2',3'-cyclic phosphodiesterase [Methanomicrobiaceae archaeon]|nr:RNA 2',3'-cyclic phosphodiesterase [Methanomicrobiaceae archaeon]
MTRVFIAIELPLDIKQKISEINELISDTEAKLNIVNPDISHITLKFIGEANEKKLEKIKEALAGIKYNKYEISLEGISFNSISSPRVIWINGYDKGMSASLADILEESLFAQGIEKERRPYKIHATIARVKRYHPSLKPVVQSLAKKNLGKFEVSGFKLKKSILTPNGPKYEDLMEVLF